jgi:hypothetical protein
MKEIGVKARQKRKFKVTTDFNHNYLVKKNLKKGF